MIIIYKLWKDTHTKDFFFNRVFQENIAKNNVIIPSKANFRLTGENSYNEVYSIVE